MKVRGFPLDHPRRAVSCFKKFSETPSVNAHGILKKNNPPAELRDYLKLMKVLSYYLKLDSIPKHSCTVPRNVLSAFFTQSRTSSLFAMFIQLGASFRDNLRTASL